MRIERAERRFRVRSALAAVELRPVGEALGGVLRVLRAREERAPQEIRDAAAEQICLGVAIDDEIHERSALIVDAVDAVRA